MQKFGARADFLGLDVAKFPHGIGFLGRYGPALNRLPHVRRLWAQLAVEEALRGLAEAGLAVQPAPPSNALGVI